MRLFTVRISCKIRFLSIIYSISALVITFWSLGFWFTLDSSLTRLVKSDNATGSILIAYIVAFIIYSFFYYCIMKGHFEWVVRMVRLVK